MLQCVDHIGSNQIAGTSRAVAVSLANDMHIAMCVALRVVVCITAHAAVCVVVCVASHCWRTAEREKEKKTRENKKEVASHLSLDICN